MCIQTGKPCRWFCSVGAAAAADPFCPDYDPVRGAVHANCCDHPRIVCCGNHEEDGHDGAGTTGGARHCPGGGRFPVPIQAVYCGNPEYAGQPEVRGSCVLQRLVKIEWHDIFEEACVVCEWKLSGAESYDDMSEYEAPVWAGLGIGLHWLSGRGIRLLED
ncbi:hypothetical protein N657DRAFT_645771 [Parathielavia appendiculata]|uniref:Uncharacterized protein n=1 Tax=Parathielavia appendiculata TaxID=2587402 RepID=A0AAN6TYM8_9PEZI|nr:hypothetical protein N657DRAFT_645771 [Parathielavia appendiculata]